MIFLISLVFMGISMLVSWRLKNKFEKYSQVSIMSGMSGKEIAEKIIHMRRHRPRPVSFFIINKPGN